MSRTSPPRGGIAEWARVWVRRGPVRFAAYNALRELLHAAYWMPHRGYRLGWRTLHAVRVLIVLPILALLAGCGGSSAPKTPDAIFAATCGTCHTLKAAGTGGRVGPNLDDLKPDAETTARQITNGGGGMPSFKGELSPAEIDALAQWVAKAAAGS